METQRMSHQAFSFTKTLSYKWKHSFSFMAEQSGMLDLSKEFMASIGNVIRRMIEQIPVECIHCIPKVSWSLQYLYCAM